MCTVQPYQVAARDPRPLMLSTHPHLEGWSYYLPFADNVSESQRDLSSKDLNPGLSANAILSPLSVTDLPEKSTSTALLVRGG